MFQFYESTPHFKKKYRHEYWKAKKGRVHNMDVVIQKHVYIKVMIDENVF